VIFSGHGRSQCLQQALEGGVSHMCPVSAFQQHDGCTCIADENATADLKMKTVPKTDPLFILPACLLSYLPTFLPAYPPACLPTCSLLVPE
jgi:hypothetical protein